MQFSSAKVAIALATASSVVMTQTPPEFVPATEKNLQVRFKSEEVVPGAMESKLILGNHPTLAFDSSGEQSYLALMLDISVVLKPNSTATTLIHWIKPGLRAENGESLLGSESVGSLVPYIAPNPPPGQVHDYPVLLFEQPPSFNIPGDYESYFANISASINNRIGFNVTEFTESVGLKGEPIAGNWFRVSTPEQASSQVPTITSTSTEAARSTQSSPTTALTSGASKDLAVTQMMGLAILAMAFACFADY